MKNYFPGKFKSLFVGLVTTLFAVPCLAQAGNQIIFTIEMEGNRIGYQKLEWSLKNGMPYFSEKTVLEVVHGKSRSIVKHEFSSWLKQVDADLYFAKTLDAGTVQEHRQGRIENGRVQVKNAKNVYVNTSTTLPAGVIYPSSQLQWYLGKNAFSGSTTGFDYFDPQLLTSVKVKVSPCVDKGDFPAAVHCRLRSHESGSVQNAERWFFDAEGKLLKIDTHLAGIAVVKRPCLVNCMDSVKQPWDFIGRLVVQSPYRIPGKLARGKINYLISSKSGRPLVFLDSAEQRVQVLGDKTVVSVCANCKVTPRDNGFPDENDLKSNVWVQSDNSEIRRLALSAVSGKAPVKTKMLALVKLTQKKMTGTASYIGYSSALDALHSGSGDCSEFALLLTAFARAQGVPARVVFGMAYSSRFTGRANVFSPHAWVQVWEQGHWVSYDAALNEFDATHIALAESNGNPEEVLEGFNQLGDIRIEKAAAITAD